VITRVLRVMPPAKVTIPAFLALLAALIVSSSIGGSNGLTGAIKTTLDWFIYVMLAVGAVGAILALLFPALDAMATTVDIADRGSEATPTVIEDSDDLDWALNAVGSTARGPLASRLAVLTVADTIWRSTVSRFAERSDVVLMDISVPSEQVVWELEHLSKTRRPRVLVGQRDRVAALADGSVSGPHGDRLRTLLDGEAILTYRANADRAAARRFAVQLRARLERRARRVRSQARQDRLVTLALKPVAIGVGVLVVLSLLRGYFWFSERDDPTDPFEGTEAASFAAGEAAIVLPAAAAVPGFTGRQVDAALDMVRDALIAGRLDEAMLYDHDPAALLALLSESGREPVAQLLRSNLGGVIATRIAPGYRLTDDGVRADGRVEFESVEVDGVRLLVVQTAFVWVYAFTGDLQREGDHLVTVSNASGWVFRVDGDSSDLDLSFSLASTVEIKGIDCELWEQGLIALDRPGCTASVGKKPEE
jgi:hypothetical protein